MSVLMPNTTFSIWQSSLLDDNELRPPNSISSGASLVKKASGIPGRVGAPGGSEIIAAGGEQENLTFKFVCDPCNINHLDILEDESTGKKYEVQWVVDGGEFGLEHKSGAVRLDSGSVYSS